MAFTCANVIAVRVKEELVAPACCSGVGLGGEGNEDWDTFTSSGAEEGLPKGKVPTVGVVPRAYFAKKTQGDQCSVRGCAFSSSGSNERISTRKAELSSVAAIFWGQ